VLFIFGETSLFFIKRNALGKESYVDRIHHDSIFGTVFIILYVEFTSLIPIDFHIKALAPLIMVIFFTIIQIYRMYNKRVFI
jgi:hypothetical protein